MEHTRKNLKKLRINSDLMMENLINLILSEIAVALVLVILLLLIIIWELLKKYVVTVTVVTVKTEAASYDHGDTVNISGDVTVDGTPQTGKSVGLKITDSVGTEFALSDATTDADGKFTAVWTIPPEVAPGVCTVSATALGATATTTFTSSNKEGKYG
jgi:hypothetical protein